MSESQEKRPDLAIGHVSIKVDNVAETVKFYAKHGMREILNREDIGITELRGGTHIVIRPTEESVPDNQDAPFDFMVDDVDDSYSGFKADNREVTELARGDIHDDFKVKGPSNYWYSVCSSHAGNNPV